MPTYQSGSNITVAYKAQSGLGTPASGASGLGLRFTRGSAGMRLTKSVIESAEVRRDGQSTRGRHGSRQASGSYQSELSVGSLDTIIEAAMRSTWTAALSITQATMTSITTTTSTIVAAGGSWLTQGVRVGDMVKLSGHDTAANNDKWFRVVNVTATTVTVAGTPLVTNSTADLTFTLAVAKSLVQGSSPTERYFTIDEYFQDVDRSLLWTDCKFNRLEVSASPDSPIICTIGVVGLDGGSLAAAASPQLTSPTYSTTLPLVLSDGTIRLNGVDYADLTALSFALDVGGAVPPVLAANSPDVFLGNAKLSGSVSGLRTAFTHFDAFDAETQIDIFAHCVENEANPADFVSFYVGNAVFDGNDAGLGDEGAQVETFPWRAGKDEAGGSRAATMLKVSTSAA